MRALDKEFLETTFPLNFGLSSSRRKLSHLPVNKIPCLDHILPFPEFGNLQKYSGPRKKKHRTTSSQQLWNFYEVMMLVPGANIDIYLDPKITTPIIPYVIF